jgi:hypothetical protein
MTLILQAVANTPLWVYPAAAAILWLGARNLTARESRLGILFVHPVIVLGLEIMNLVGSAAAMTVVIPAFVASLMAGGAIGWNLAPTDIVADRARGTVRVPGSVAPLLVAIAVVIQRYVMGYAYSRWPEFQAEPVVAIQFSTIGAVLVGIVWGRIIGIVAVYRRGLDAPAASRTVAPRSVTRPVASE